MNRYEDECLSIDLPDKWKIHREQSGISIVPKRGKLISIGFMWQDYISPQDHYGHLRESIVHTEHLESQGVLDNWQRTVTDPFRVGRYSGCCVSQNSADGKFARTDGLFLLRDCVIMVFTNGLNTSELKTFWECFADMTLDSNLVVSLERRLKMPAKPSFSFDATDLSCPKTKRIKTWMDHNMILLMDRDSYPENGPEALAEGIELLMPCSKQSMYVSSQTEWDVALEFVVSPSLTQSRKIWWEREQTATIYIPTGHLHVEQTTGGLIMDIKLSPGEYHTIARRHCPPDADAMSEGVEKIQITLVPINANA